MDLILVIQDKDGVQKNVLRTYDDFSFNRVLSGVDTLDVSVFMDDPVIVDVLPWSRIAMYINDGMGLNKLLFRGVLPPDMLDDNYGEGKRNCTYVSPAWLLKNRYTDGTDMLGSQTASYIVEELLQRQNARAYFKDLPIGVTTTVGSGTALQYDYKDNRVAVYDVLDDLVNKDNAMEWMFVYTDTDPYVMGHIEVHQPYASVNNTGTTIMFHEQIGSAATASMTQVAGVGAVTTTGISKTRKAIAATSIDIAGDLMLEKVVVSYDTVLYAALLRQALAIRNASIPRLALRLGGINTDTVIPGESLDVGSLVNIVIKRGFCGGQGEGHVCEYTLTVEQHAIIMEVLACANPADFGGA